jgi:FG-GAP repeat
MKKILGIFICMLLMLTIVPAVTYLKNNRIQAADSYVQQTSRNGDWIAEQKIFASDGSLDANFGGSVSLDGDTALIGAVGEDPSGSAYIFIRSSMTWIQQAKLVPSDGGDDIAFGFSVSLFGDTALIGAPGGAWITNYSGSAYVFIRNGTTWTEQAKLVASDGVNLDNFGSSVALYADSALIGACLNNQSGSVYVFTRTDTTWTQLTKLTPSDGFNGESFGESVALGSNTALIGAVMDDDNGFCSGSAYVFTLTGTTWTEQAKLIASDGATMDFFGNSVSISGDTVLIGDVCDNDNGENSGSAYIFFRTGSTWIQQAKLLPSDGTVWDYFSYSISIQGNTALIGAIYDDDNGTNSGSAYVFTRTGTTWIQAQKLTALDASNYYCFGTVSLDGDTALIGAEGGYGSTITSGLAWTFIKQNMNNPPIITNPYPANGSTAVARPPDRLSATVEDGNSDLMDIHIKWKNHEAQWVTLQTYTNIMNGTYNFIPPASNDWIWGNTIYTWSVNVTDGYNWTNETYTYRTGGSRYDVNNNDIVNFQDAGLVWVHRTSLVPYDGLYDINQDNQVNFQDAGLTWVNRD